MCRWLFIREIKKRTWQKMKWEFGKITRSDISERELVGVVSRNTFSPLLPHFDELIITSLFLSLSLVFPPLLVVGRGTGWISFTRIAVSSEIKFSYREISPRHGSLLETLRTRVDRALIDRLGANMSRLEIFEKWSTITMNLGKGKGSVSRAEAKVNGLGPRPPFAFHVNPPCQQARVCATLRSKID